MKTYVQYDSSGNISATVTCAATIPAPEHGLQLVLDGQVNCFGKKVDLDTLQLVEAVVQDDG